MFEVNSKAVPGFFNTLVANLLPVLAENLPKLGSEQTDSPEICVSPISTNCPVIAGFFSALLCYRRKLCDEMKVIGLRSEFLSII